MVIWQARVGNDWIYIASAPTPEIARELIERYFGNWLSIKDIERIPEPIKAHNILPMDSNWVGCLSKQQIGIYDYDATGLGRCVLRALDCNLSEFFT